jgi:predicted Zn-dependent protease with MMP-like domain
MPRSSRRCRPGWGDDWFGGKSSTRIATFFIRLRNSFGSIFHGVPATKKSVFDVSMGPAHIVLYQKNIEAVCSSEAEVRHQIRQTLIHELGHYFGMTEEQLRDV